MSDGDGRSGGGRRRRRREEVCLASKALVKRREVVITKIKKVLRSEEGRGRRGRRAENRVATPQPGLVRVHNEPSIRRL